MLFRSARSRSATYVRPTTTPWDSPQALHDIGPYYVLAADVIEKGTANPNETSGSHGPTGPVASPTGTTPEPEVIGVVGGNVSLPDGSAQWRQMSTMNARNVYWNGNPAAPVANIIGYW